MTTMTTTTTTTTTTTSRAWHPIASAADLVPRHVYQGQLLGRELAAWRADDGHVNVWENRCLHRGVRLSIAVNDGRELKCQYHGWRYANRTAACTYIPAHPADAPARTISNRTYAVVERHGLIWTTLEDDRPDDVPELSVTNPLPLRALAVNAPATAMQDALESVDGATLFVQPVDDTRCAVRGVLHDAPPASERLAVLREWHLRLAALRDRVEAGFAHAPGAVHDPVFEQVPAPLAELPRRAVAGRSAPLRVRVARKWTAATDIAGFELAPLDGALPTAQPGSHLDVHLPTGDVRQYSVVNAPGDGNGYVIGVKREPQSRGGSVCLHDVVREGDVLAVSEPRNNFPLRRDADLTLLLAGGIGVTPLLAMAGTLHHQGLPFRMHYFAQGPEHFAFPERLAVLGDSAVRHGGLSPAATQERLTELLADRRAGAQLYVCGPGPMIETVRRVAADHGWPESRVHFEYFKNANEIAKDTRFELALARSCLTVDVEPGQTILEAIRGAGVDMPSSCEQGACGTCVASVIEGEPVHQDVYLNAGERASRQTIITCVSRCASARLVLDI